MELNFKLYYNHWFVLVKIAEKIKINNILEQDVEKKQTKKEPILYH